MEVNESWELHGEGEASSSSAVPVTTTEREEEGDFNLEGEFQDDFGEEEELLMTSSRLFLVSSAQNEEEDDAASVFSSNVDESHETTSTSSDLEFEYQPGISLSNLEFGLDLELNSEEPCLICGADYESDLQLAAELGKTLLERNKELETSLKNQQAIIDDQSQEIEYLTKQTVALREVNESRVKIYEQLEESITELESNNKKIIEENQNDKSKIKSLSASVNRLELRCEELQRALDEQHQQQQQRDDPLSLQQQREKEFLSDLNDRKRKFGPNLENVLSTSSGKVQNSNSVVSCRRVLPWEQNNSQHHQHNTSCGHDVQEDEDEIRDLIGREEENDRVPSLSLFNGGSNVFHKSHHHNHHHHQETCSSGYSSSSIEYHFSSSSSASPSASLGEEDEDRSSNSPDLRPSNSDHEEEGEDESREISTSDKFERQTRFPKCPSPVQWEAHKAVLDQVLELQTVCEGLKSENIALRNDCLDLKVSEGIERPHSVAEEVSRIEIVRSGKLCRRCLGPVEVYSSTELLSQAACQIIDITKVQFMSALKCLQTVRQGDGGRVSSWKWQDFRSERVWIDVTLLAVFLSSLFLATLRTLVDLATSSCSS